MLRESLRFLDHAAVVEKVEVNPRPAHEHAAYSRESK
jgi:hypothetical protein